MISIVCPFYNEESVVDEFFSAIGPVLSEINYSYEIVCVNDGSDDKTFERLKDQKKANSRIRIINLSRNFGKEAAITAGLDYSKGKAVIPIDADLQDPPELIPKMIKKWEAGSDIVLAKRVDRLEDTYFKRVTAGAFYKIHNLISDSKIPENVGDYRLMDRRVVDALSQLPERERFMKGLFSWVGFKVDSVEYSRKKRVSGNSKFNGWKLWNFALDGITSFSTSPLRVWLYLGMLISTISFCYAALIMIRTMIYGVDVPGYASIVIAILFLGGVQLIGIGVLGEYVGRIYMETKARPLYLVRDIC
jgi:polyisoprenyl-phosphate glycosyltransferase